jgi:hypothetical protein
LPVRQLPVWQLKQEEEKRANALIDHLPSSRGKI